MRAVGGECSKCGCTSELHAHHIYSKADHPSLESDFSNGAALCSRCHFEFHSIYGKRTDAIMLCRWLALDPLASGVLESFIGWKDKGGVEDLKKARHFLDILIHHQER